MIYGASFVAVLISLPFLRTSELRPNARAHRARGSFTEGLRYVWGRPDLKAILIFLFLIGTFRLNFPIFISTMAVGIFHADARGHPQYSIKVLSDAAADDAIFTFDVGTPTIWAARYT